MNLEPVDLDKVLAARANGSLSIETYKELIDQYNEEYSAEPTKRKKKNGEPTEPAAVPV